MIKVILLEGVNSLMYSSAPLNGPFIFTLCYLKKLPYIKTATNNKIKQRLIHSSLPF